MEVDGGDNGDRTHDLCIANAALSQLSYIPTGVKTHRQNDALNYKIISTSAKKYLSTEIKSSKRRSENLVHL